ncbi:MAG: ABC transporter permease, partial [Flavobacteriaceae bacterium]|nr:ABC transporter permease [Flavobacteriaceae bacterium]
HNMIIVVVTLVIFQVPIEWAQLLIIPAMLLLLANLTWIGVIISVASSRYRDIPQIVTSLLQPIFFLTPIIWTVDFNPIYHLVELVRAPVLGQVPSILTSGVSLGMVIFGWMIAVLLYGKYQYRIAYWVI